MRKSIVQATFKELFEFEEEGLVLRATPPSHDVPSVTTIGQLEEATHKGQSAPWIVDAAALRRGELVELQVELQAEAIYRMSATLSGLIEVIEDTPELINLSDREGVLHGMSINRALGRLLAGLVPLTGRALNYQQVTSAGRNWLVHDQVLAQIVERDELATHPVQVVGVADTELFWKDIRRVAFSHSSYFVMCRLNRDGLQAEWTPIKLVEVIREFLPDLALQLDAGGQGFLQAMADRETPDQRVNTERHLMRLALIDYAGNLAAHYGHLCDEESLATAGLPTNDQCDAYKPLDARRDSFRAVTEYLHERYSIPDDRLAEAQFRSAALLDSGLGLDPESAPSSAITQEPADSTQLAHPDTTEHFLDTEFVAIYW